ncbi:MAG: PfkB family carbohydrate kinase [Maricaulaceae bacterium]
MKTVLLISSFLSASQVGATASAFCLRRLGLDVVILPTTLFGRHPGWGAPGGHAVPAATLSDMWTAIAAQNIEFDGIMTGYMAAEDHIDLAVNIIKDVRAVNPATLVLVDPVKGDDGRLYIPEPRAKAIAERLVPKANILTPNLYELEVLTGRSLTSLAEIISAARDIGSDVLVTSVPKDGQIGALWVNAQSATYVGHDSFKTVPNGGGDSLAALFLARRLQGMPPRAAQQQAVSSIFDILSVARHGRYSELPLTQYQAKLSQPKLLDIQDILS